MIGATRETTWGGPRAAASLDGVETFSTSVPLTEFANAYTPSMSWDVTGRGTGNSINVGLDLFFTSAGHTNGLAADADGSFHPTWIDNHTGVPQLWTARVTVNGAVSKNGAADVANLDDISKSVILETSNVKYDRARG